MIIGITGYIGAGKDVAVDYLKKQGFKHISLSDILRAELKSAGLEVTRKNLQEIGNNLRNNFGAGVLAERALLSVNAQENWIISSIGTVGEIQILKKNPKFRLVFIDAPLKTRFQRVNIRAREGEAKTFKEFKKTEEKEKKGAGANYRAFDETKKIADFIIMNDDSLQKYYQKIDKVMYVIKTDRPSWDEYFMGIMQAVRERGTCDRGKTGCVITRDNRILVTGYVGSPAGIAHCDEVGHLIQEIVKEDGSISKHCIRTIHAEQNAICQAAREGLSIDKSTLYCYMEPCYTCAKMIINAGIKRVVAAKAYHGAKLTRVILQQAGVKLEVLDKTVETYANMGKTEEKKEEPSVKRVPKKKVARKK